jgi:hypothetical protein
VVVVAGRDHQLPLPGRCPTGQGTAEILEEGAGDGERVAYRPVAQLEHVAEQHHSLHVGDHVEQRPAQLLAPQQVGPRAAAEMQVGDD